MTHTTDFLVIGSGLAGLMYALKVAEKGQVTIITKSKITDTNTNYAQGGIASVAYRPDNCEKHIKDTLIAGDGLCDEDVVRTVITTGPNIIQELIDFGAKFDKNADGSFDLGREGGHSENRIYHHKDKTGEEIQRALTEQVLKHPNIKVCENHYAVDLITQHHLGYTIIRNTGDIQCFGAYVLNPQTHKVDLFLSKITYMATGGLGNIYDITTNPEIATGDGIAMAYRAKALITDMEFVQFHPTGLYNKKERPAFLITEAMRGFGAILRNHNNEAFMEKYDKRKDLAPRDIVARAIDTEMKISGKEHVFLDCTHLNAEDLKNHFPNIYKKCLSIDIDFTKDYIPVAPAAHYLVGGIRVNNKGKTSIKRLYAAGECSSTGLHGANRLASNSLLEALVYANKAAEEGIKKLDKTKLREGIPQWSDEGTTHPEEMILITQEFKELRLLMTNYVGIVRTDLRLDRALSRLNILYQETRALYDRSKISREICELRNSINIAYLIIKMAKSRKESRGLHYNINYPNKSKIL
ncbi:MAG: L-aspartate oxidase [Bacteroidia bacterium]|nr:MAG: L-aspartate oxidase [Bacteroidia bacterium]